MILTVYVNCVEICQKSCYASQEGIWKFTKFIA